MKDGTKFSLKPFTPFQVYQDQVKMRERELEEKKSIKEGKELIKKKRVEKYKRV